MTSHVSATVDWKYMTPLTHHSPYQTPFTQHLWLFTYSMLLCGRLLASLLSITLSTAYVNKATNIIPPHDFHTMASDSQQGQPMAHDASFWDTLRVLSGVVVPTLAKGVIKRRPIAEGFAQHHGLDTAAAKLLQDLRRKYGSGPLTVPIPLRPQLLILDPKDAAQVLDETPVPFGSDTKEKRSVLSHFEPGNILISDAAGREKLRPVHEEALATNSRVHPFAERFQAVVSEELSGLVPENNDFTEGIHEITWDKFALPWSRIVKRIVLGDSARDDEGLMKDLDDIRQRSNWGFLSFTDHTTLERFQSRVKKYLESPDAESVVSHIAGHSEELDIPSQVAHYLFAFDPAGMATFRALALLGSHAEEQRKAAEEARNASSADRPYSRAVLLESLRLWPTTPAILRGTTRDTELGGKTIPKGTQVVIFAPFFHRDDERLDFAHKLSPERWLDTEVDIRNGLLPFSAGQGMCPAHNLVPMVASLAIDEIVKRAKVELAEPNLEPGSLKGTLDHFEIKLRLTKREDK